MDPTSLDLSALAADVGLAALVTAILQYLVTSVPHLFHSPLVKIGTSICTGILVMAARVGLDGGFDDSSLITVSYLLAVVVAGVKLGLIASGIYDGTRAGLTKLGVLPQDSGPGLPKG